jgi:hypothetical protein
VVIAGPLPPNVNTAQNAAMKWIKLKVSSQQIEGEQPNCHFTINEGDAGWVCETGENDVVKQN